MTILSRAGVRNGLGLPEEGGPFYFLRGLCQESYGKEADMGYLQWKIDRVAARGKGLVKLGDTRYTVHEPIKLRSGIQIVGKGNRATHIYCDHDVPAFTTDSADGQIYDVTLSHLWITREGLTGPILELENVHHSLIQNCIIERSSGVGDIDHGSTIGIEFIGPAYHNVLLHVQVRYAETGIQFIQSGADTGQANSVFGGAVKNCTRGIVINQCKGNNLSGIAIQDCSSKGIEFLGAQYNNVSGCFLEVKHLSGEVPPTCVSFDSGSTNNTITGCVTFLSGPNSTASSPAYEKYDPGEPDYGSNTVI